ncbi:uncharacterized protein LOC129231540 [Uloborus diversus]|uniref:uncharacterized protein LOC129231540 n=1 Tax=Uloborus diversus TaxID=327109 RepID=UPI002409E52B|nr:uncharacterized protein LOC129231540 [Uloborus diversus]
MRLGGRLEFSEFSLDNKHPVILPTTSAFTRLIVLKEHEKIMHGGTSATLAKIRSRFWIPKGRQLIKKIIKNCLICQKYLAKPADQMTEPLPKDRIQESPPFSNCGIDFAGPVYVKNYKDMQKSYIVLFTCAVTRAVHLELVSNMSTQAFLLAFRRFLSRRDLRTGHRLDCSKEGKSLKIGDVVLLEGSNKNKFLWPLGIITELFKGREGLVRACTVKTKDGQYRRPIQLVYPLEMINGP